jgi:hypothetical protein
MLKNVALFAHNLLPRAGSTEISKNYINTIKGALSFVDTVLNPGNVRWYKINYAWGNGERYMNIELSCTAHAANMICDDLVKHHALHQVADVSYIMKDRAVLKLQFGSYRGLDGVYMVPDNYSEADYIEHGNNLSLDMSSYIANAFSLAYEISDSDFDSVRWFTDRLPVNEVRGEHLLEIQNFMYRMNNRYNMEKQANEIVC